MLWLNGEIIAPNAAHIAPNDRGFLLADGLFETMRAETGEVVQLQDHLDRLRVGMTVLGIDISYDDQQISDALMGVLVANSIEEAALRLTVTRGTGPRGLVPSPESQPTVMITCAPYAAPPTEPARLTVSTIRRNEHSPLCNVKALNYLDNILALQQAKDAGFDDAIMLNSKGNVVCTTTANIFMQLGDKLITPALSEGALPGVMRKSIMEKATAKGLLVEEDVITLDDLKAADEIFITNSLIGRRAGFLFENTC